MSAPLGLLAEFRTADELSRALAAARREGYTAIEAFAPFPMAGRGAGVRLSDLA